MTIDLSTDHPDTGVTVVAIAGVIDVAASPDVETFLLHRFSRGDQDLVVDMRNVTSMTVEGLTSLMAVERRVRAHGGRMRLADANGPVLELLERTGAFPMLAYDGPKVPDPGADQDV